MAAGKSESALSLVISLADRITGPLAKVTAGLKKLTAPITNLNKGFGEFSKVAGFGKIADAASGLGGAVKNVGSEAFALGAQFLAMAGAAGFALFTVIRGAVTAGDELAAMADHVGVNVDTYASLGYAARQADIDQEQFNGAIAKFSKNLGDAKANGGSLLTFLEKVSPALAQQVKGAKSTEEGLSIMTDAFVRLKDPAKRAALSAEAFGKSGVRVGDWLHQGSAAIQKQQGEYMRLAGSQEAFARNSSDLDNAMKDSEAAFDGVRAVLGGALFPVFTKLTKAVTEFIVAHRDGIQKWAENTAAAIQKWIDGGGIQRVIDGIGTLAAKIGSFVDMVGGWQNVLIAIAAVMAGPLISAIVAVIPAVYGLGVALLTTPVGWFILAIAAIAGSVYLIYKNWGGIVGFFSNAWDSIKKFLTGLGEIQQGILSLNIDTVMKGWTDLVDGFKGSLDALLTTMRFIPGIGQMLMLADASHAAFGTPTLPGAIGSVSLGADQAAGVNQSVETKVTVDFANMPKGTRVTQDSNSSQSIDLNLGYSMTAP